MWREDAGVMRFRFGVCCVLCVVCCVLCVMCCLEVDRTLKPV